MVITIEVPQKAISCSESCLTSVHGGNYMSGFKAENVTGQRYSREQDSRTNGRSSNYRV